MSPTLQHRSHPMHRNKPGRRAAAEQTASVETGSLLLTPPRQGSDFDCPSPGLPSCLLHLSLGSWFLRSSPGPPGHFVKVHFPKTAYGEIQKRLPTGWNKKTARTPSRNPNRTRSPRNVQLIGPFRYRAVCAWVLGEVLSSGAAPPSVTLRSGFFDECPINVLARPSSSLRLRCCTDLTHGVEPHGRSDCTVQL